METDMWDVDTFPGAGHVPWQLLIRARQIDEIDAVLATAIVGAVAQFGSREQVAQVARAAAKLEGPRDAGKPATAEQRTAAIDAAADFDDYCGNGLGHFGPRPHYLEEFGSAAIVSVLAAARRLIEAGGSQQLRGALGEVVSV
jgi:hypothetical protein